MALTASGSSAVGANDPLVVDLDEEDKGEISVDPADGLLDRFSRPVTHRHYVNRLSFGPRKGEVAAAVPRPVEEYIESQLSKTSPDPAVEQSLGAFPYIARSNNNKNLIDAVEADNDRYIDQSAAVRMELTHSNFVRAVESDHQLFEMMCQFWMDHFNVQLVDVGHFPLMISYQEHVIRPNAMGSFRELLKATAHSTAMLEYLDNRTSNANSPEGVNENYGRELLELHTLGIHNDGSQVYNEDDVYAASLAMSGWTLNYVRDDADWLNIKFNPRMSHSGSLSLLNGQWSSGGLSGKAVGDSLLDFLAGHESTARYIAEKLCRRFVSDNDRPKLVASAAKVYLDNDTQIVPVLRHIFRSKQFGRVWHASHAKARKPFEVMVAMMRAADTRLDRDPRSEAAKTLAQHLEDLNHRPWHWPTPDGYPDDKGSWLTTAGLVNRFNLGAMLSAGAPGYAVNVDHFNVSNGSVTDLVQALSAEFGLGERPADQVATLAEAIGLNPGDSTDKVNQTLLLRLVGLFFAHPDFQVR